MNLYIENEKGRIDQIDHRLTITKVRGGWTEDKIKRDIKNRKGTTGELSFYREVAKYDTPEEFSENLFYHGSGTSIGVLKPSIVLKNTIYGGGYGDKYYGISLSRDKNIASNFTGTSHSGNVAPVLLRRGSVIKTMPEIRDSEDINDIIIDLWTEGVDAVIIGDHSKEMSEKEVVVLNPSCIAIGKPEGFRVFQKPKMPSLTKEELTQLWVDSSEKYKTLALESWERSNERFKEKFGRDKSPETRWTSKQKNLYNFHQHNLDIYEQRLKNENNIKNKKVRKNKLR